MWVALYIGSTVSKNKHLTNIDEYQIRDLTFGDQRWRIDWFDPVTYAERYRRKSQPLIEIQLSHLTFFVNARGAMKADYATALNGSTD